MLIYWMNEVFIGIFTTDTCNKEINKTVFKKRIKIIAVQIEHLTLKTKQKNQNKKRIVI